MVCSSCGKQRNELSARKSKLMPGVPLFLCTDCIKGKKEPRYLIILVGRQKGPESVAEYIRNSRYCGEPILASELIA
ncbi:hypothetical protein PP459_gp121 [Streptomyces phage Wakanda]|uniref:Uncharacterized protein n=2 Tax=Wakandavirus TaxID=3044854 RepID=A0A6G8R3A0_9CAUD|nr:hypothetical protein PP459_gp121 [Streptomyces phage Wakanda]YP_010652433.1 hypothetical protein PP460_gp125 [Streptomyces phage Muntaha]QIN94112.1 hypothetical protein SEA_WAKANDA_145 [Streptomyces phage Wakanda]QIN94677.1 hypothetical protein SEA_MUNTAHA_146 [Streptomyces phage Muntaha]